MNAIAVVGCLLCLAQPPAEKPVGERAMEAELKELELKAAQSRAKYEELRAALKQKEQQMAAELAQLDAQRAMLRAKLAAKAAPKVQGWQPHVEAGMRYLHAVQGQAEPAWVIGVSVEPEDKNPGILILEVIEDSPAQKAKVKKGDRLVAVNGIKVARIQDLQQLLGVVRDQPVKVRIQRPGSAVKKEEIEEVVEVEVTPMKKKSDEKGGSFKWTPKEAQKFWRVVPSAPMPPVPPVAPVVPGRVMQVQQAANVDKRLQKLEDQLAELKEILEGLKK